ncbi:hypothetical protein FRX31_006459 [Thalictrum thalictroides]|uniref:CCHC-type domain-containing protein n=1 Tax=Thalictrum thalictroides TaxID=46969 RepID=A0A7J6X6F1_THATH|nr:hypothetical protein FRX31_006459 [Thalictrum thalictroides]
MQLPLTYLFVAAIVMMGSLNVPIICCYNGKLIDEDKNPRYIGGDTKVGVVSNTIGFIGFKEWIRDMVKLSTDQIGFEIKCRYRIDDHTLIAIKVDNDHSLKFVFDHSLCCNAIVAYVVNRSPTESNTMHPRLSEEPVEVMSDCPIATVEKTSQEVKLKRRVGRPSKNNKVQKRAGHRQKGVRRQPRFKAFPHCSNCRELGHNRRSCPSTSYNSESEQNVKIETP